MQIKEENVQAKFKVACFCKVFNSLDYPKIGTVPHFNQMFSIKKYITTCTLTVILNFSYCDHTA